MATVTIRVKYLTGDRWNSNVGRYRATGAGRQVTLANNFTDPNQYERVAKALAEKLDATLDPDSEQFLTPDAQVRTFTATYKAEEAPAGGRVSVADVEPGWRVTVFAHPAGRFGVSTGQDVSGWVKTNEPTDLPGTTSPGRRITFTDGRTFDAVAYAVATHHHAGD